MADLDKLYQALDAADKAGAQDDVRDLTSMIKAAKTESKPKELRDPKSAARPVSEMDRFKDTLMSPIKGAVGLGDVGLSMATGALAQPIAGAVGAVESAGKGLWRGGKALATGGSVGAALDQTASEAADTVKKIQHGMTYQPRTEVGKGAGESMSSLFEMSSSGLGQLGGMAGGVIGPKSAAAGQVIGENLLDAIGSAAGVSGLAKGLKGARTVKPELSQRQDAIAQAQSKGYFANPEDSAGGVMDRVGSTLANPQALDAELAAKNAKVSTEHAKRDLGIPPESKLDNAEITKVETKAKAAYEDVAKAGDTIGLVMTVDSELANALGKADSSLHPRKASFPTLNTNPRLEVVRAAILNPNEPPSVRTVMETARQLREDAVHDLKSPSISATDKRQLLAMKTVATALEDFVERKLGQGVYQGGEATPMHPAQHPIEPGPRRIGTDTSGYSEGGLLEHNAADGTDLLAKYREARVMLAKARDVREAANLQTGHIDPAKLANKADKLTGGLADIVQAHQAMGNVVKSIEGKSSPTGLRAGDAVVGAEIFHALTKPTGIPLATRKIMASDLYRKYMANPTVSSLDQLKKLDPALAAKAVAALSAAQLGNNNSPLPPPIPRYDISGVGTKQ